MNTNLDTIIERRNTGSLKWDSVPTGATRNDLIPLWVADMDFPAPDAVRKAIIERSEHGVYGYGESWGGFESALCSWMSTRHGWRVEQDHIVPVPGVMAAVALLIEELTEEGEGIIIQPPVYPPFKRIPGHLSRKIVENPLVRHNGRYEMDIDGLETACRAGARMALLCSPHNPVGRVWNGSELESAVEVCGRYGVPVVVDEIHCDILPWKHRFTPALSVSHEQATVVSLVAPTKTFNLAGLSSGAAIIDNELLRKRYRDRVHTMSLNMPNILSTTAAVAAYSNGSAWLDDVLQYVRENELYVSERLGSEVPDVVWTRPEGTYLAWLDFTALGLDDQALKDTLLNKAGVWLNHGPYFGTGGSGFQRLNLACPRGILAEATDRLVPVLQALL